MNEIFDTAIKALTRFRDMEKQVVLDESIKHRVDKGIFGEAANVLISGAEVEIEIKAPTDELYLEDLDEIIEEAKLMYRQLLTAHDQAMVFVNHLADGVKSFGVDRQRILEKYMQDNRDKLLADAEKIGQRKVDDFHKQSAIKAEKAAKSLEEFKKQKMSKVSDSTANSKTKKTKKEA